MDYPQQHIKPYDEEGKKTEQVERMFDNIAHAYDKLNHTLSLGIDRSWRRKAIAWLRPFRPQHIMDVATGTGDFAILACRELNPDELIGTDISEGMMNVGREKVKKEGLSDKISFAREDCTSLSFADNRFDAITVAFGIRNFEDLDKGLSEMCRVLKPGGKLLNFDANWYGYLYDEEKRLSYEEDRKSVESEHLDDHYLCTDIDRMEKIALQMPLSSINRPSWDRKFLKENGFESVAVDTGIWQRVWSQEEKLNYHSTPMFMISAVKEEKNVWSENDGMGDSDSGYDRKRDLEDAMLCAAPGMKKNGFLRLGGGEFSLPYTVICGSHPGKTVLITAAVHGGEYVGIQAAVELADKLKPEKIHGRVILVKTVCRKEFCLLYTSDAADEL